MNAYSDDDDADCYDSDALAYSASHEDHHQSINQQGATNKIAPAYGGNTSWFAYEELIDEWIDMTNMDKEKQGPALKQRLYGEAAIYKSMLDRDKLKDPDNGVTYFKNELRSHFVKGAQSVFLWRFMQLFRFHRGQQDFLRWLGRLTVLRKRLRESWCDLLPDVTM